MEGLWRVSAWHRGHHPQTPMMVETGKEGDGEIWTSCRGSAWGLALAKQVMGPCPASKGEGRAILASGGKRDVRGPHTNDSHSTQH